MFRIANLVCFILLGSSEALIAQPSPRSGTVKGTVTVSRSDGLFEEIMEARALNRYGDHAHSAAEPKPYGLSEKIVVYIISQVSGPHSQPPSIPLRLDQQDMMFRPLVLPIVVGSTVEFPNNDNVFHNVFSYSSPREFDLGRYPIGKSKKVTFDRPGVVNVYCDIHAYMYATILVLENQFFTTPDNDGAFVIQKVPEGSHELGFWYGKKLVGSKMVSVKAGETTVVDLEY